MASSLIERMLALKTKSNISIVSESSFFKPGDQLVTDIPVINVALSGRLDGGMTPGLLTFGGESKSFKTMMGLLLMRTFLDKEKDGLAILYDSEYGITPDYLEGLGIDTSRVLHIPIKNVEELVHDAVPRLDAIDGKKDKVFILIDSVGNLASKKEAQDALDGKGVTDMSRAKALKSMFRIITPYFMEKGIFCVVIQHVYKEIGAMYPRTILAGGTGNMYSSNAVLIITKSADKDEEGIKGFEFTLTSEKSRYVREKARMKFRVSYEKGIYKNSSLFDWAVSAGFITQAGKGWWAKVDRETGEVTQKCRRSDIEEDDSFFDDLLKNPEFSAWVEGRYKLSGLKNPDDEDTMEDPEFSSDDEEGFENPLD